MPFISGNNTIFSSTIRKCWPTLGMGVSLLSGASWVMGAVTLIMPAAKAIAPYMITHFVAESLTPSGFPYEVALYNDAGGVTLLSRFRVPVTGSYVFASPILDPSLPVYGSVTCQAAGATIRVSLIYGEV